MNQLSPVETKRLILRRLQMDDKLALFSYRSLPEVALYQSWHPSTLSEVESFIQKTLDADPNKNDQWVQLAICLKEGTMIGDLGIHFIDDYQVELGYTLSPLYQSQGYAYEAVSAVIDELFIRFKKHRITASVDPDNVNSIRLLEKFGFRKEAYFKKSFYLNGEWFDDVLFAILDEEWISRKGE
jgi:RimJ/RimL family protein N-acetyltransferase